MRCLQHWTILNLFHIISQKLKSHDISFLYLTVLPQRKFRIDKFQMLFPFLTQSCFTLFHYIDWSSPHQRNQFMCGIGQSFEKCNSFNSLKEFEIQSLKDNSNNCLDLTFIPISQKSSVSLISKDQSNFILLAHPNSSHQ